MHPSYRGSASGSSDEAGETAVGKDLAAGLTARAVRDLVRLERDAAELGAAHGARRAGLVVHHEVVAELRREAAGAFPFDLERLVQDAAGRLQESSSFDRVERRQRTKRRELGAMQDVVTVPAADARDAALVAQHGIQLPAVGAVGDQLRELLGGRLGAELRERPV